MVQTLLFYVRKLSEVLSKLKKYPRQVFIWSVSVAGKIKIGFHFLQKVNLKVFNYVAICEAL